MAGFLKVVSGRRQTEGAPATAFVDFASIRTGDSTRLSKLITEEDVQAFADVSGDRNPLHMDVQFAERTGFRRRVVHGMVVASYVSQMIGMRLPGPGALWTQQTFRWPHPVFLGDTVEITLEVTHKSEGARTITVEVNAVNQHGKTVLEGEGTVMVLEERKRNGDRPLSERLALVTGASRGIGAAIALALGQAGAAVVVNYHQRTQEAEEICGAIQNGGGRAITARADVRDAGAVAEAVSHAAEVFGKPVDVLVNNAGGPVVHRPFQELSWQDVQSLLDVHVRGAFNCSQAVIPGMLGQNSGRIVNIGSIYTWNSPPANWSGYLMAKAALRSMTRCLAAELGPRGIRVNIVSPGVTETDALSDLPERLRKVQAMQTPLRRLAAPDDVARVVLFLCSEGGEFLTGADIPVCGGINM